MMTAITGRDPTVVILKETKGIPIIMNTVATGKSPMTEDAITVIINKKDIDTNIRDTGAPGSSGTGTQKKIPIFMNTVTITGKTLI